MNNDLKSIRIAFGEQLKEKRRSANLTLHDLQNKSGITYSAIAAIESGNRVIGNKVAEALADAYNLRGEERNRFLLQAAATCKQERLLKYTRELSPEVVNYVAQRLEAD